MTRGARTGRALGGLMAAVVLMLGAAARAQDGSRAADLSRDADRLMSEGKYAEACPKLAQSLELDPRSATALELGSCYEGWQRPGSAYRAYGTAMELGQKEKRNDRVNRASAARTKLSFKFARVVIRVPPAAAVQGLRVTIDGETLPEGAWNNSYEADPGNRTVVASAPGKESWEKKATWRAGNNVPITVPALRVAGSAQPAPQPGPKPGGGPQPQPQPGPQPEPTDDDDDDDDVPDSRSGAEGPAPGEHESNRFILELGFAGGLLYSNITRGRLSSLIGVSYEIPNAGGSLLNAECGDVSTIPGAGECEALFADAFGGVVGGHLFVGWAVHEDVHLGARALGAKRFPNGFIFVGGPSISGRPYGPLWLGATFLLGVSEHKSALVSAKGSVPVENQPANGGNAQIDIPPATLTRLNLTEGDVDSGLLLGGSIEISIAIVGPDPHAAVPVENAVPILSGALMLSVWPSMVKAPDGYAVFIPGGLSYRFF